VLVIPKAIKSGVNFRASAQLPAYSNGWQLLLYLRGPSAIDLLAAQAGNEFTFSASAAQTAAWAPGDYAYSVRATNGGDVVELDACRLTILPDLAAAAAGHDARSENRVALDAIKAVLAKRATIDQDRYRINNRELYRTSIKDLLALKAHYQQLVNDECCTSRGRGRVGSLRVGFYPMRQA
jgi:hypothetical protein